MTVEEEVAELTKQMREVNIRLAGLETISQLFNGALVAQSERISNDERWLVDVSAIARHTLEHAGGSTKDADANLKPVSAKKKDTQTGIEVA